MKRILACILLSVYMIMAFSLPMNVLAIGNNISALYGTPVVNGDRDKIYEATSPLMLETFNDADNGEKMSVKIEFAWDDDGLFMFVSVKDPSPGTVNVDPIGDIWKTDCVEIDMCFNPAKGGEGNPNDDPYSAIILVCGQTSEYERAGMLKTDGAAPDVKVVSTPMSDGFTSEIFIPWLDCVNDIKFSEGTEISVGSVYHFDSNDDFIRDGKLIANAESNKVNSMNSQHDKLVLGTAYIDPDAVTETAAPSEMAAEQVELITTPAENTTAPQTIDLTVFTVLVLFASACGAAAMKKRY